MKLTSMLFVLPLFISKLNAQTWPIHIEAENYASQSGITKEIGGNNATGEHIGSISANDNISYTVNIPTADIYEIRVKTSGYVSGRLEVRNASNAVLTYIDVPATPSNYTYITTTGDLKLPSGSQTIKIYALNAGWNLDCIDIDTSSLVTLEKFEVAPSTGWVYETCRGGMFAVSDSFFRRGLTSGRFEFTKNDSACQRAEIKQGVAINDEYWYGFSHLLAHQGFSNGSIIPYAVDEIPEILAQWHGYDPIRNEQLSPPVALGIQNGRYYIQVLWDSDLYTPSNDSLQGNIKYDLGVAKSKVWHDWVFHIKWSYESDGILEVWHNNKLVLRRLGANWFNDQYYPYFKLGIYKWGWNGYSSYSTESKRVVYIDEVRVGNKFANFNKVSPR